MKLCTTTVVPTWPTVSSQVHVVVHKLPAKISPKVTPKNDINLRSFNSRSLYKCREDELYLGAVKSVPYYQIGSLGEPLSAPKSEQLHILCPFQSSNRLTAKFNLISTFW